MDHINQDFHFPAMTAKAVEVCGQELTVLNMGPDGAGKRYDGFNDTYEDEPFDESRSGIKSILSGAVLERFLASARLPLYDGGPGCVLSEEQEEAFGIYYETYLENVHSEEAPLSAKDFSARMAEDLVWLDKTFGRIYAYEGQLNEFLAHAGEREYQALWKVLKDFALDAQPDMAGRLAPWSCVDAVTRFLSPRWVIKDLLAIFANKTLRRHVFRI